MKMKTRHRSKLDLEPNPFEKSFSAAKPDIDSDSRKPTQARNGNGGTRITLPPIAEIESPRIPGGASNQNSQSLRSGPLSPAMLEGPASNNGNGGGRSRRTTPRFGLTDPSLHTGLTPFLVGDQRPTPLLHSLGEIEFPTPNTLTQTLSKVIGEDSADRNQHSPISGAATATVNAGTTAAVPVSGGRSGEPSSKSTVLPSRGNTYSQEGSLHTIATAAATLARYQPAVSQHAVVPRPESEAASSASIETGQSTPIADTIRMSASPETEQKCVDVPKIQVTGPVPTDSDHTRAHNEDQSQRQQHPDPRISGIGGMVTASHSESSDESPSSSPPPYHRTNFKPRLTKKPGAQAQGRKYTRKAPEVDKKNGNGLGIESNQSQKREREESEEMKRQQFLERNRIAALKCRQRKKQRLMELQGRVEWLTDVNERLKTEAMRLREEALYIRSLLQAHQNCSITQVNQAAGLRPVPVLPPMQKVPPGQPPHLHVPPPPTNIPHPAVLDPNLPPAPQALSQPAVSHTRHLAYHHHHHQHQHQQQQPPPQPLIQQPQLPTVMAATTATTTTTAAVAEPSLQPQPQPHPQVQQPLPRSHHLVPSAPGQAMMTLPAAASLSSIVVPVQDPATNGAAAAVAASAMSPTVVVVTDLNH